MAAVVGGGGGDIEGVVEACWGQTSNWCAGDGRAWIGKVFRLNFAAAAFWRRK